MRRAIQRLATPLTSRVGPVFALEAILLHLGTKHREFDR